ncbi:MAG: hypothetical protein QW767_04145 [Thermoprotei archaeon]
MAEFYLSVFLAASMAAFTVWIIKRSSMSKSLLDSAVNSFALGMMGSMFAGGLIYLVYENSFGAQLAVWLNMAVMSGGLVPVVGIGVKMMLNGPKRRADVSSLEFYRQPLPVKAIIPMLILLNELFMSSVLAVGSSGYSSRSLIAAVGSAIPSYWFILPMAAEMIISSLSLTNILGSQKTRLLLMQGVNMALVPTWQPQYFQGPFMVAWAATMGAPFLAVIGKKGRELLQQQNLRRYLIFLLVLDLFEATGFLIWIARSEILFFEIGVASQMLLFFYALIDPWAMAQ